MHRVASASIATFKLITRHAANRASTSTQRVFSAPASSSSFCSRASGIESRTRVFSQTLLLLPGMGAKRSMSSANDDTISHELKDDKSRLDRPPYKMQPDFKKKYEGRCFCGSVKFELSAEPKAGVCCHCRSCQRLHGAPMTLTSIFSKEQVQFTKGAADSLVFYSPQEKVTEYRLPVKLSCKHCHSPMGNEGNNMMLVAPAMIDFEGESEGKDSNQGGRLPEAFMPTFHQYYHTRIRDIEDDLPKFGAEKGKEPLNEAAEKMAEEEAERKEAKQESEDLRERKSSDEDGQSKAKKKNKKSKKA